MHGGAHGAWCWERGFLEYFADRGYRAIAISLRGHGASTVATPRYGCSIGDYVADLRSVAGRLPARPVLIGHSMGGFVVQKHLEACEAPAAVLLASIPPRGTTRVLLRAVAAQLRLSASHLAGMVSTVLADKQASRIPYASKVIRQALFSGQTAEPDISWCAKHLRDPVSARAVLDMMFLDPIRCRLVQTPLLVLGAQDDALVSNRQVHATARAYRTSAKLFPGMGHDMMLETQWHTVAAAIHQWLVGHDL